MDRLMHITEWLNNWQIDGHFRLIKQWTDWWELQVDRTIDRLVGITGWLNNGQIDGHDRLIEQWTEWWALHRGWPMDRLMHMTDVLNNGQINAYYRLIAWLLMDRLMGIIYRMMHWVRDIGDWLIDRQTDGHTNWWTYIWDWYSEIIV